MIKTYINQFPKLIITLFILAVSSCSVQVASTESETELIVSLIGTVSDEQNNPVEGIVVTFGKTGLTDITDENGDYEISSTDSLYFGVSDTLEFFRDDNLAATYVVSNLIDTLPDIILVRRSITGEVISTNQNIRSVYAYVYSLNHNSDTTKVLLDFFPSTNRYSGFADFNQGEGVDSFSVFVKVFDTSEQYIGRSYELPFSEKSGDLTLGTFNSSNMVPQLDISPKGLILSGEQVSFKIIPTTPEDSILFYNEIESYSWKIDDSLFGLQTTPQLITSLIRKSTDSLVPVTAKITYNDGISTDLQSNIIVIPDTSGERLSVDISGIFRFEDNTSVEGVTVVLNSNNMNTITTSDGNFHLDTIAIIDTLPSTDTISFWYNGQQVGEFEINGHVHIFDSLTLVKHQVMGEFKTYTSDISILKMVIIDEVGQISYEYPIEYVNGYKNYSDTILAVYKADEIYTGRVRVYSLDRKLTGESDDLIFDVSNNSGNFSSFEPKNMVPELISDKGTSGSVGDSITLTLNSQAKSSLFQDKIHSIEWAVSGGLWGIGGRDSTIIIPDEDITQVSVRVAFISKDTLIANTEILRKISIDGEYGQDMTESDISLWSVVTEDNLPTSISLDTDKKQEGNNSLFLTTESGFDVSLVLGNDEFTMNASELDTLKFSLYTENSSKTGFQDKNPIVVVVTESGSATYTPSLNIYNMARDQWQDVTLPFLGGQGWERVDSGVVDFSTIHSVEFHGDTWDYGYNLWIDDVKFVQGKLSITKN